MKNKTPFYKLDDDTIDSLNRFLKSNNIVSYFVSVFLNGFWAIGKGIKILLKKDKIEQVEEIEIINENHINSNFSIKDVDTLLSTSNNNKPSLIFIDLKKETTDISGALDYSNNKKEEFKRDYNVISLNYIRFTNNWLLNIDDSNEVVLNDFNEIDILFKHFIIEKMFINNLVYYLHPETIINNICVFKEAHDFEIEYAFHDYLSICPSYFLLNKQGLPCDFVDDKTCDECLYNSPYRTVIRNSIREWRASFKKLFDNCDKITMFSDFSKNKLLEVYIGLDSKIVVEPHKALLSNSSSKYIKPRKDDEIRIGFVGNFHHIKGADFFIDLVNMLINNGYKVKPIVIGYKQEDEYKDIDYLFTGPYKRSELGKLLTDNKIDLVVYPSINSETFSYIVQELMILKVPIVLFRRGAPAERIEKEKYGLAEIADNITVDSLYQATIRLLNKL